MIIGHGMNLEVRNRNGAVGFAVFGYCSHCRCDFLLFSVRKIRLAGEERGADKADSQAEWYNLRGSVGSF